MIHYELICKSGHGFDCWFSSSVGYEQQRKARAILCPHCGTTEIDKQIMAPNIGKKSNSKPEPRQALYGGADSQGKVLIEKLRELRKHVETHADYVGDRFAEEARRIHYKETEERGIYGEATAEDARSLIEEGIEVHPLPPLPEDRN
jgi:hypothetical protein